jgi:site-specific DNA recombinase
MKTIKTKALIYCRVSSERQVKEGHGLDSQEKRCRDYAKNKGYEVVKVFTEEGVSGGLFERPAMKSLIQYLDDNSLERFVIIFDDLARFARDVQVHLRLKAEFVGRGASIECLNFNFEDSPAGELVEIIMAGFAQYHRQDNKRQVIQKMKARLEAGYWPFMPPLGLINKKDPIHGKVLTPREPYASIFKEALEKYSDGILCTPNEVRLWLHDEFKRNSLPNRPPLSSVQEVLKNPLYAGYIEYQEWDVPFMKAKHEGFISLDTFNRVQERLKGRSKPWQRRDYSLDFPLRPHVICAGCSTPMTASWNTGRSAKYPNYKCRVSKDKCIYAQKTISKYKIEPEFENLLKQVKPAEELIELTKQVLIDRWEERNKRYSERRSSITAEVMEAENSIESYIKRIAKTESEDMIDIYENKISELKGKIKEAEKRLNGNKYTAEQFGTATDKVFGILKKPMSMWKSDEYDDKRTILFMYFEEQLKYDYERGFGTASLAYPIKLINAVGQAKNGSVEMSGSEPECEKS